MGLSLQSGCLVLSGGCVALGPCSTPLTPDCCNTGGYCFDKANMLFRGHVSASIPIKGIASAPFAHCIGTAVGVLAVAFDYEGIPVSADDFCIASILVNTENPSHITSYLRNIVITWTPAGGSPVDIPLESSTGDLVSLNLLITYGDAYGLAPNVWSVRVGFSINLYQDPTNSGSGLIWGGSNSLFNPLSDEFSGDAIGITPFGPYTYCSSDLISVTTLGYDHTEASVTASIEMETYNNYCCLDGADCAPSATPLENPDGTCS